MIQVIYGRERPLGRELLLRVRAAMDAGERMLVLVPEMATLQTEAALLEGLGLEGSFDLEVLSPSRLSEKLFEQKGQGEAAGKIRIDEQGKAMAAAGALREAADDLRYYGASVDRQGFIAEAASLISDFKRAKLTPESLMEYAQGMAEGASRDKMQDLARIFGAYEQRLAGGFVDGEDVSEAMLQGIIRHGFARGAHVAAWGFDVLTGELARIFAALEASGGDVAVLLRAWPGENLFRPALQSVGRLQKMCAQNGIAFRMQEMPQQETDGSARGFLREQFVLDNAGAYAGLQPFLRFYTGATPYFEMRFVAREIRRLHDREGIPYGGMGVFFCDESYAGIAEAVFEAYGVPAYVPRSVPASTHGAARFLLSSLRCVSQSFQQEDLLALLRSGFAPLQDEDCWQLENYISSWRVRGRRFLAPFDRGDPAELAVLEEKRAAVAQPLLELRDGLSASRNTLGDLTVIYRYLEACGIYDRLQAQEKALLERDMESQASRGRQVWRAMMRLMDEMAALYGPEKLARGQLTDQLEAGLKATELRTLPQDSESVLCAPCGRSAADHLRAVFVVGLNEGTLTASDGGLITDEERKALEDQQDTYIGFDADGRDDLKKLDLYSAICAAEDQLIVTNAAASQAGDARQPHIFWNRLRRMFPDTADEGSAIARERVSDGQKPLSLTSAADELALLFGSGEENLSPEWQDAWRSVCRERPDLASKLVSAFRQNPMRPLDRQVTGRLFMENTMSVSRLESFAACPYRHFVEYGLRPHRKKEWDLDRMEIGSFYHEAVEGITRLLPSLPGWPEVRREDCDRLVEAQAGAVFAGWFGDKAEESAKVRAAGQKYIRVLKRTAWMFTRGAQVSAFRTVGQEITFGYADGNSLPAVELDLEDGRRVLLQGRIDRIDRYEGDEGVYLRVVDYKSGQKELKPADIYYGTQLQLLLYLHAALTAAEDAQPAGAYYMFFRDPLLKEIDPEDQRMAEEALAKKLRLSGISLKDARILQRMDGAAPPLTLEPMIKKDGEFAKNKPLASLEEMAQLLKHAREAARKLCVQMRGGHIAPEPLAIRDRIPCDRCDIRNICRLETRHIRYREDLKFEDLYARLRDEEST